MFVAFRPTLFYLKRKRFQGFESECKARRSGGRGGGGQRAYPLLQRYVFEIKLKSTVFKP